MCCRKKFVLSLFVTQLLRLSNQRGTPRYQPAGKPEWKPSTATATMQSGTATRSGAAHRRDANRARRDEASSRSAWTAYAGSSSGTDGSSRPARTWMTMRRSRMPTSSPLPSTTPIGPFGAEHDREQLAEPLVVPDDLLGRLAAVRLCREGRRQHLAARHVAHELAHVVVGGRADDLGGRTDLDEAPVLHDRDPVAELQRLVEVVRDEDDRLLQALLQAQRPRPASRGGSAGRARRTPRRR